MNAFQIALQLRHLLRAQTWTGSATKVFQKNSVRVSVGPSREILSSLVPPIAIIRPMGSTADPEEPELFTQTYEVLLATVIPGDEIGENALVGGNRQSFTDSRGRGLLEVEEELLNAVAKLSEIDGVRIQVKSVGATQAQIDENSNYITWREYSLEGIVTGDRFYHPVTSFSATGGTGEVSLEWSNPPSDRYDLYRVRLVRKSGATAPTSVTDGTEISLGSSLPTSYADSGLASGTYSYSIFASYDETNTLAGNSSSADDRTSDASSEAGVVVA